MSIRINPLSVAKGHSHSCELCSQTATYLCAHCKVTYYCSARHQEVDWLGIHNKICSLLCALRSLRPTLGSAAERQKRQVTIAMSHHALIDLCRSEAQKHLVNHQYEYAIPAALQALRFSIQIYGKGRLELVPSYLLLAESNLGLHRLKNAEEYLLYANWSIIQSTTECDHNLLSLLHRNFGHLYQQQHRLSMAVQQFSLDVYHSSICHGPEHILTTMGMFHLGVVCHEQHRMDDALALFDKYIDIWYKFLTTLQHRTQDRIEEYLTEAQLSESAGMMIHIIHYRSSHLSPTHIATGEACYTLAIHKQLTGYDADAYYLYSVAEDIYGSVLGMENESTQAIRRAKEELPSIHTQTKPLMPHIPGTQLHNNTTTTNTVTNNTTLSSTTTNVLATTTSSMTKQPEDYDMSNYNYNFQTYTESSSLQTGIEERREKTEDEEKQQVSAADLQSVLATTDNFEVKQASVVAPLFVPSPRTVHRQEEDSKMEESVGDSEVVSEPVLDIPPITSDEPQSLSYLSPLSEAAEENLSTRAFPVNTVSDDTVSSAVVVAEQSG